MSELEKEIGGWERTAKDLVSGAAGGIAQVLLGQPFGRYSTHVRRRPVLTDNLKTSSRSASRPPTNTNLRSIVVAKYLPMKGLWHSTKAL
jgi:hypothetical protein